MEGLWPWEEWKDSQGRAGSCRKNPLHSDLQVASRAGPLEYQHSLPGKPTFSCLFPQEEAPRHGEPSGFVLESGVGPENAGQPAKDPIITETLFPRKIFF